MAIDVRAVYEKTAKAAGNGELDYDSTPLPTVTNGVWTHFAARTSERGGFTAALAGLAPGLPYAVFAGQKQVGGFVADADGLAVLGLAQPAGVCQWALAPAAALGAGAQRFEEHEVTERDAKGFIKRWTTKTVVDGAGADPGASPKSWLRRALGG